MGLCSSFVTCRYNKIIIEVQTHTTKDLYTRINNRNKNKSKKVLILLTLDLNTFGFSYFSVAYCLFSLNNRVSIIVHVAEFCRPVVLKNLETDA